MKNADRRKRSTDERGDSKERPIARVGVAAATIALLGSILGLIAATQPNPIQAAASPAATAFARTVQESRCADCHFANLDAPARGHLSEWDLSPHGRNDVGCESCHGGDASTFEPFRAHREILPVRDAAAPTNPRNLPRTCGSCHSGPFSQFQKSRHKELLDNGDERGPTCSTCHGTVGAHLLSPRALASQCASCHGTDGVAPRPDHAAESRYLLESIGAVRSLLDEAESITQRIQNPEIRSSVEYDLRQAEVPLIDAVISGHAFRFDAIEERLSTAQQRAQALLERLVSLLE